VNVPAILEGLNAARIRYVVVGGVAANAHGSARITLDLDICYDPDSGNAARLTALLAEWQAYLRGADPGLPWVLDARTLRDTPVLTLMTSLGALDIMDRIAGVGEYPRVRSASERADIGGVATHVITLDALIAAKRATGRRKDREALLELEALREIVRRREVKERATRYRTRRAKK